MNQVRRFFPFFVALLIIAAVALVPAVARGAGDPGYLAVGAEAQGTETATSTAVSTETATTAATATSAATETATTAATTTETATSAASETAMASETATSTVTPPTTVPPTGGANPGNYVVPVIVLGILLLGAGLLVRRMGH